MRKIPEQIPIYKATDSSDIWPELTLNIQITFFHTGGGYKVQIVCLKWAQRRFYLIISTRGRSSVKNGPITQPVVKLRIRRIFGQIAVDI